MAKYYLTLGYPLAVAAKTSIEGYTVEISNSEKQVIPNEIALEWANLLSCGYTDNKTAVEKLAGRGILLAGQTKGELLRQCNSFYPFRQGIGSTFIRSNADGSSTSYFAVRLDEKDYTLSDFQRLFWNEANGHKTVSEILTCINSDNTASKEDNLASQLFALIKFGLMFIRK